MSETYSKMRCYFVDYDTARDYDYNIHYESCELRVFAYSTFSATSDYLSCQFLNLFFFSDPDAEVSGKHFIF